MKSPAVLRGEGLDRRQREMTAARHPRRDDALVEIPDAGIGELMHGDVVQAGLDIAPLPRRPGAQQAGSRPTMPVMPLMLSIIETPTRVGGPSGSPVSVHEAGFGLHQEVVARPVGTLVGAAIGGDMQADDRGLEVLQAGVVDAEPGGLRAAQVVDHAVGGPDQSFELPAALGRLEVEGHALLCRDSRPGNIRCRPCPACKADLARGIALGRFDLDHLGAQLGQEHGAVGPGAELFQGQDADALEGPSRGRLSAHSSACRLIHCLAMMMRCISLVPSPMQVSGASR